MNKYLLCIGSNTDREFNMQKCKEKLSTLYPDIEFSEMIETEPVGDGYIESFFNQLVIIETNEEQSIVDQKLNGIEIELGRLSTDKSNGIVKIDVDLLAVNETIIKQDDFKRPYIPQLLAKIDYPILAY